MAGSKECLHLVVGRTHDGFNGRRNKDVGDQHREVLDAAPPGQVNAHGVSRGRGFKPYTKEDNLFVRILDGQFHRVERRVDHANVAALAFDLKQIAVSTGDAEHVSKRAEDDPWLRGNRKSLIDEAKRSYADGTAGAMDHLDASGQHLVNAITNDGVCLAAANLHDLPRTRGDLVNLARHALGDFAIAELGEVLHFFPPLLLNS